MFFVLPDHVDEAWRDGASALEQAYAASTPGAGADLKAALLRGEKTLLGNDGGGWAAVEVLVLKDGERVLHVEAIYGPGATTATLFDELKAFAAHNRCAAIQGMCPPAVARLWARRFGFRTTFQIMRYELWAD